MHKVFIVQSQLLSSLEADEQTPDGRSESLCLRRVHPVSLIDFGTALFQNALIIHEPAVVLLVQLYWRSDLFAWLLDGDEEETNLIWTAAP
jgi:hypothetical protein